MVSSLQPGAGWGGGGTGRDTTLGNITETEGEEERKMLLHQLGMGRQILQQVNSLSTFRKRWYKGKHR